MKFSDITKPTLLWELLKNDHKHIDMPCGGGGRCGKCKVTAEGELSPFSKEELKLLTADEREKGVRLACRAYATGPVTINYNSYDDDFQGITFGDMPDFDFDPLFSEGLGVAIDIGTTTLAGYLYDLSTGRCLKKHSEANLQRRYGADVITRIEQGIAEGMEPIYACIQKQVADVTALLCDGAKPKQIVVTGNTVMLHFYEGLDPRRIAVAPFTPESLFGYQRDNVFIPKCMSPYVGADISCAILAGGMTESAKTSLLIDIGTNGEMALWHNGKLYCCSTAAGPAFEGAGISQGMPGVAGAINTAFEKEGKIIFTTIDGAKAQGICGSGLVDAVAVMLRCGIVDETGIITEDGHDYTGLVHERNNETAFCLGDSGIYITQKDIRQVQLAKAAICAGIYTLLHQCGGAEPEELIIAGGFGSFINCDNAAEIGLFPKDLASKTRVIGNGAGTGASMMLLNKNFMDKAAENAENAEVTELSANPVFMEKYIDCMMF